MSVYSGAANLANGNLTLIHPVTGWSSLGPAVRFAMIFNSQGSTTSGVLGPKWRHSYKKSVSGTNPAVVTYPDGRTANFSLVNQQYQAPAGIDDQLVRNADQTWHLTRKDQTRYRFDATGRLVEVRDRNLNVKNLAYDGSGRLSTVTDAVGRALTLLYDASGRIQTVRDFEQRNWTIGYGTNNRPTSVSDPLIGGQTFTTQFGYNTADNVTSITNRLGHAWTYAYVGNVFHTVTAPGGFTAGAELATASMAQPDTLGFTSQANQGGESADNSNMTWPLDTQFVAYVENEANNAMEYGLSSAGRVTAFRSPTGQQTNFSWNTANRRTAVTEPGGATSTFAYDARGNVTSTTDPLNRTTTRTYDTTNNLLTETNHLNQTQTFTYDARGNRLTHTDATSRTTTSTYNANGTVATMTDPGGNTSTMTYNGNGELTEQRDPLNNATTYVYANGRVTSRTDARGRTTTYSYDAWGRLTGVNYPVSTDQTFTYDAEGRLTQAVDGTGTRTYTYNNRGLKTGQTDPRGTTTATYDAAGRLTSQTDVTGRLVQYQYDAAGRLTRVQDPTSWAQYAYDTRGRVASVTLSNGVVSTKAYDSASQLTSLTHRTGATGPILAQFTGTYDNAGRLTQMVEGPTAATTTMTYDAAGRLLTENRTGANAYASTYTYNPRGLRATAFRSEGAVTSHNGTYTYDAAGRLTLVTQPSLPNEVYTWNADSTLASLPGPGHTRNLEFDEEGRMISLSRGSPVAFEFGYGFDGARRWSREVAANVQTWLPCGVQCSAGELAELTSTNGGATWSTASTNLTMPTCGGGLVRAGSQFVLRDLVGRVARATDSTGSVVASATFDLLGVQRFGTGSLASGVIRDTYGSANEDGLQAFLAGRTGFSPGQVSCVALCIAGYSLCVAKALLDFQKCVRPHLDELERIKKRCRNLRWPKAIAACIAAKSVVPGFHISVCRMDLKIHLVGCHLALVACIKACNLVMPWFTSAALAE